MRYEAPTQAQHIDIDAFHISVEALYNPKLREVPAATYHPYGPITSANYLAKAEGIDSTTRIKEARKIDPNLVLIEEHLTRYDTFSALFFMILKRHNNEVEYASRDEAYIDWSDLDSEEAKKKAIETLEDAREKLKLGISSCLAPNKFLAKIGTNGAKPNGFWHLPEIGYIERFYDWPVEKVPGIGEKTGEKLRNNDIQTIGDLAQTPPANLTALFKLSRGAELYDLSRGIDKRPVIPWYIEIPDKSIGNTLGAYQVDPDYKLSYFRDFEQMLRGYRLLASRIEERMGEGKYDARTVVARVRHQENQEWSGTSKSVKPYFKDKKVIISVIEKDLLPYLPTQEKVDRIGASVINLRKGGSWLSLL